MNKEDYVSLEAAKLLKEKRYNCICDSLYTLEGLLRFRSIPDNFNRLTAYSCPSLYESQKWIRETQKIHICVDFNASGWYCRLYDIPYGEFILQTEGYKDSYEEALNAGILEALKLIE